MGGRSMKRKKRSLGASEGDHFDQMRHHLDDRAAHDADARIAGTCKDAIREMGNAFRSYGTAAGHVQGIPDDKLRTKLITHDMASALVKNAELRDEITRRCAIRKPR